MQRRVLSAVAPLLFLAACAGGSSPEAPAPAPFSPAGTYDFSVDFQGQSFDGVMTIAGSPEEGFTGSVNSQMGTATLTRINVQGNTMTFSIPDADASAEVVFEGEGFSGEMSGEMGAVRITGVRREPARTG